MGLSIAVYALWFGLVEKRAAPPKPAPGSELPVKRETPASEPAPDRKALEQEAPSAQLGRAEVRIHPRGAALVSCRYREPLGTVELVHDPRPGFLATWPELTFQRDPKASGVLSAMRPDGVRILKEFIPEGEGTLPRLRLTLTNAGNKTVESGAWTISLGPGLGTIPSEESENPKLWRALGLLAGQKGLAGKVEVFKPGTRSPAYRWVGVDNRYFLAALLASPEDFAELESRLPPQVILTAKSASLPPGASRAWEIPYYLGAKGHTWLSRYRAGLERSIDFGFFAQLGRLALRILDRLHRLTGNWGWSVILLTILLQILLFPLTYKSLKATAAMKRLQPEIARLQQRYAKEPQRLNAEMMDLYKKQGANPLGGCLPMLLQMPVFIALFNALRNAWELHGAPWILWIKDLSAKDPYYVLPLLMGGLMFLQGRLNPPSADPAQAKIMSWMPLIFTFMFLNFPSGLVLYWLTSSVLSTLQQIALKGHFENGERRS